MRILFQSLICFFYFFVAVSSAIVEISEIQKPSAGPKTIKPQPRVQHEKGDVFMVLNGTANKSVYDTKELIRTTENELVGAGLNVITEDKFDYLNNRERLDYFVIIEHYSFKIKEQQPTAECNMSKRSTEENSNYYYYIVSAKDFEIKYISSFQTLNSENIRFPFLAKEITVQTDQCKYFNTFQNKDYNSAVTNASNQKIQEISAELLTTKYSEEQINIEKKKQELINDKYIILLNLATSQFLTEQFNDFDLTLKKINFIRETVAIKNNYTLKDEYLEFLKTQKSIIVNSSPKPKDSASNSRKIDFYFDPVKDFSDNFQRMCMMNALIKIEDKETDPDDQFGIKVNLLNILRSNCEGPEKHSGWFLERLEQLSLTPPTENLFVFRITTLQSDIYYPLQCRSTAWTNNISVRMNLKLSKFTDGIVVSGKVLEYKNTNPTAFENLPFRLDDMISKEILNDNFKTFIKNATY